MGRAAVLAGNSEPVLPVVAAATMRATEGTQTPQSVGVTMAVGLANILLTSRPTARAKAI